MLQIHANKHKLQRAASHDMSPTKESVIRKTSVPTAGIDGVKRTTSPDTEHPNKRLSVNTTTSSPIWSPSMAVGLSTPPESRAATPTFYTGGVGRHDSFGSNYSASFRRLDLEWLN